MILAYRGLPKEEQTAAVRTLYIFVKMIL